MHRPPQLRARRHRARMAQASGWIEPFEMFGQREPRRLAVIVSLLAGLQHATGRLANLGWASFLILGPITGSLTALCLVNIRKRRPIYAACCIAGIVVFWIAAPALLKSELSYIQAHKSGLPGQSRALVTAISGRTS